MYKNRKHLVTGGNQNEKGKFIVPEKIESQNGEIRHDPYWKKMIDPIAGIVKRMENLRNSAMNILESFSSVASISSITKEIESFAKKITVFYDRRISDHKNDGVDQNMIKARNHQAEMINEPEFVRKSPASSLKEQLDTKPLKYMSLPDQYCVDAEMVKGGKLSEKERELVEKLSALQYHISAEKTLLPGNLSIRSNALTARGGGGRIVLPNENNLNQILENQMKNNGRIISEIKSALDKIYIVVKGETTT